MTTDGSVVRRVLQVHTRYRQAGGEDEVVDAERRLLESAGIEVDQVVFDNAGIQESVSLFADAKLALDAIWSPSAYRQVRASARRFKPDIIHVHNTWPAASPSVFPGAAKSAAVVHTLHNYRLVCPAATAFRDGHPCTDCVGKAVPWPSVVHACVRESHRQSLVAASALAAHRARGTWRRDIGCYVALTEFQRNLMLAGGIRADRITVVPNFLDPDPGTTDEERSGVVFAGRLSTEKGIRPLIAAADAVPGVVRVAGAGQLEPEVEAAAARGALTRLGAVSRAALQQELRTAVALVVPSIWFEGFPMVIVEAMAAGTPVIASRIGSLEGLVEDGVTGLLVPAGDAMSLGRALRWSIDHAAEMRALGLAARARFEARYRGANHLEGLLHAYALAAAVRDHAQRGSAGESGNLPA